MSIWSRRATQQPTVLAATRKDGAICAHFFVGSPRNIDILLRTLLLELHPTLPPSHTCLVVKQVLVPVVPSKKIDRASWTILGAGDHAAPSRGRGRVRSLGMRGPPRLLFFVLCGVAGAAAAQAPGYPARPIRMIVPFAPGGGSDVTARILSAKLSERLQQRVVVDNRTGAGGAIGAEIAAKAPPDGYTLLLGSASEIALYPAVATKVAYDPVRDFAPVALAGDIPFLLVTHPSLPGRDTKGLIALARAP